MTEHVVKIVAGVHTIVGWQSYEIVHDMLDPTGSFTLSIGPATLPLFAVLAKDSRVRLYLDDVLVLDGFIDESVGNTSKEAGSVITVTGRDRGGRLVDEDAPLVRFAGMGIKNLALAMAQPWVERVDLSNSTNRRLVTGGLSAKAGRVSKEPPIDASPKAERKVQPGERRWQVLSHFLEEGKLLAWLSADGKALIVGKPNYDQEPSFRFIEAPIDSPRADVSNVESLQVRNSVGDMWSQITVMADVAEGEAVSYVKGTAKDGDGDEGIGNNFQHRKTTILLDQDVRNTAMAVSRAERELARQRARSHALEITVKGHSQLRSGAPKPTLYAIDTMARVESESWGISGDYLITRVRRSQDKPGGAVTSLSLVPKGTELTS